MPPVTEDLTAALGLLQAGRLAEAEAICRRLLAADPVQADACHLLGIAAYGAGNREAAAVWFRRAIAIDPRVADFHNNLATALVGLGQAAQAEAAARAALELNPGLAEAQSNLGNALQVQGRPVEAAEAYRRALAARPNYASAANNLGIVLAGLGRADEAIAAYRQALAAKADSAEAAINLGNLLQQLGRWEESIEPYRVAVAARPSFAEAACSLATSLHVVGRLDEAIAWYRQAAALKPGLARAHGNLGTALRTQLRYDEAVAAYRQALAIEPQNAGTQANLAGTLAAQGRVADAVTCYRQALALDPRSVPALANFGGLLFVLGNLPEAEAACRQAAAIDPDYPAAHANLGNVLKAIGRLDEAVAEYRRAMELAEAGEQGAGGGLARPLGGQVVLRQGNRATACDITLEELYNNLGSALQDQGRLDEAAGAFRRAMEINPKAAIVESNYLFCLQYQPGMTPRLLAEAHTAWNRHHAAALTAAAERPVADSAAAGKGGIRLPRRLRLGFVSPDLRLHPVGLLSIRAIEALDRRACEVVCYSNSPQYDELSARFAAAGVWRPAYGMSDDALARQIRADGIDVLFDLAGHTAGNRLLVFARKPAPVAITWIGYEGTTGVPAIDYLLADRCLVPEELEGGCCERVLRMPECYVCYESSAAAPEVGPLPALTAGRVTFGSLNNPAKITPEVVRLWAEILRRMPAARLLLKYRGFDDAGTRCRYAELFASAGIDASRLDFCGWSSRTDALETYGRIDLALDTFPFSGGLTTCEALWMGVPVITLPGATFASRHSLSYLSNIGLQEKIARDPAHYVELAVELAGDLPRLAALRAGLRARMAASPLCDGPRFATNLLSVIRERLKSRGDNH